MLPAWADGGWPKAIAPIAKTAATTTAAIRLLAKTDWAELGMGLLRVGIRGLLGRSVRSAARFARESALESYGANEERCPCATAALAAGERNGVAIMCA